MIITMGVPRILEPILAIYNVVGIIGPAPRDIKTNQDSFTFKVLKAI